MHTAESLLKLIKDRAIKHVKVGVFDIDGVLRGKYINIAKFKSALDKGFGFCDVVLGWDSGDQLYDNVSYTGWHTAYPDAAVRLLPETARELPLEPNTLLVLAEFAEQAEAICPRATLRRVLEQANNMGFNVSAACEYEFFLFKENPQSVRDKNYQGLNNFTPGSFGYSVLRSSVHAELYQELLSLCETMNFPLEGLHTETGPGVLEAAIQYDDALIAADKGALFKTFTKVWAQRQDLMATFMAKWSTDWPGQSGHLHVSIQDKQGKNIFYDADAEHNMSDLQRWFIGGQQQLMPELLAMVANTVNSYRRLVPGMWAPLDATWGIENRTCALRVIGGSATAQRVEYRIAAADMNPYLALAAAIGSGLWGIENMIEPGPSVTGNAYDQQHSKALKLPSNLRQAAEKFAQSEAAKELFGKEFVEHYSNTRLWEQREFDKAVTDWELQRYFEII